MVGADGEFNHLPPPPREPAPPPPALYASCSAASGATIEFSNLGASDEEPQFADCGASDARPQFTSCGGSYRSLGDSAPPDTELVLPKLTRTHALVKEGWAFEGFSPL